MLAQALATISLVVLGGCVCLFVAVSCIEILYLFRLFLSHIYLAHSARGDGRVSY